MITPRGIAAALLGAALGWASFEAYRMLFRSLVRPDDR